MDQIAAFTLQLQDFGAWAPLFFVLTYIGATVAFIPGAVLSLAAGAVFGFWRGAFLVFVGAVLGSSLAFAFARRVAHRRVERWLARDARMAAVGRAVTGQGLLVVLLLRLSPVIPYNLVNYALGLTQVRYRDFLMGSVGMLPGTVFYTYSGKVIGDVTKIAAGVSLPRSGWYYVMLCVGLAATGMMMITLTRAARKALEQPHDR